MRIKSFSIQFLVPFFVLGIFIFTGCSAKKDSTLEPKILKLAFGDDAKSADPAQANDVISVEFNAHIFDGLLGFSYLGELGEVEAMLAESVPVLDSKTTVLKFRIKKGK